MQRFGHEIPVQDPAGNAVPYATVAIYNYGTTNPATIYSATDVVTPTVSIGNPIVTDALGRWCVAIPDGRYDVVVSGGSFPSYTIPKVCVFDNTVTYPSPMMGTVTNVALGAPAEFTVTGSPVTGTGTLTFSYGTWAASKLLIAPTGGGTPTLRNLVMADLPTFGPTGSTTFGSATAVPQATTDASGRIVTLANVTVTPAWASITSKPTSMGASGYQIADGVMTLFKSTANVTIGNTTTETSIVGTGAGSTTMPSHLFSVGSILRIKFSGTWGIVTTTGTLRIKLKIGVNTLIDTTAQAFLTEALTALPPGTPIEGEIAYTVRTTGTPGTGLGQILIRTNCANVATPKTFSVLFPPVGNAAVTNVDTNTGSQTIDVTWQFGAAAANTTITITNLSMVVEG